VGVAAICSSSSITGNCSFKRFVLVVPMYCTILFNSSGHVTRDAPAEILVSATS